MRLPCRQWCTPIIGNGSGTVTMGNNIGLRDRISPICTLSQNGYGKRFDGCNTMISQTSNNTRGPNNRSVVWLAHNRCRIPVFRPRRLSVPCNAVQRRATPCNVVRNTPCTFCVQRRAIYVCDAFELIYSVWCRWLSLVLCCTPCNLCVCVCVCWFELI